MGDYYVLCKFKATSLPRVGNLFWTSAPDPVVVLSLVSEDGRILKQLGKTETLAQQTDPVWQSEISIKLDDEEDLLVQIFHHRGLPKLIGERRLSLAELFSLKEPITFHTQDRTLVRGGKDKRLSRLDISVRDIVKNRKAVIVNEKAMHSTNTFPERYVELNVTVKNLPSEGWNGYKRSGAVSASSKKKKKGKRKMRGLQPYFELWQGFNRLTLGRPKGKLVDTNTWNASFQPFSLDAVSAGERLTIAVWQVADKTTMAENMAKIPGETRSKIHIDELLGTCDIHVLDCLQNLEKGGATDSKPYDLKNQAGHPVKLPQGKRCSVRVRALQCSPPKRMTAVQLHSVQCFREALTLRSGTVLKMSVLGVNFQNLAPRIRLILRQGTNVLYTSEEAKNRTSLRAQTTTSRPLHNPAAAVSSPRRLPYSPDAGVPSPRRLLFGLSKGNSLLDTAAAGGSAVGTGSPSPTAASTSAATEPLLGQTTAGTTGSMWKSLYLDPSLFDWSEDAPPLEFIVLDHRSLGDQQTTMYSRSIHITNLLALPASPELNMTIPLQAPRSRSPLEHKTSAVATRAPKLIIRRLLPVAIKRVISSGKGAAAAIEITTRESKTRVPRNPSEKKQAGFKLRRDRHGREKGEESGRCHADSIEEEGEAQVRHFKEQKGRIRIKLDRFRGARREEGKRKEDDDSSRGVKATTNTTTTSTTTTTATTTGVSDGAGNNQGMSKSPRSRKQVPSNPRSPVSPAHKGVSPTFFVSDELKDEKRTEATETGDRKSRLASELGDTNPKDDDETKQGDEDEEVGEGGCSIAQQQRRHESEDAEVMPGQDSTMTTPVKAGHDNDKEEEEEGTPNVLPFASKRELNKFLTASISRLEAGSSNEGVESKGKTLESSNSREARAKWLETFSRARIAAWIGERLPLWRVRMGISQHASAKESRRERKMWDAMYGKYQKVKVGGEDAREVWANKEWNGWEWQRYGANSLAAYFGGGGRSGIDSFGARNNLSINSSENKKIQSKEITLSMDDMLGTGTQQTRGSIGSGDNVVSTSTFSEQSNGLESKFPTRQGVADWGRKQIEHKPEKKRRPKRKVKKFVEEVLPEVRISAETRPERFQQMIEKFPSLMRAARLKEQQVSSRYANVRGAGEEIFQLVSFSKFASSGQQDQIVLLWQHLRRHDMRWLYRACVRAVVLARAVNLPRGGVHYYQKKLKKTRARKPMSESQVAQVLAAVTALFCPITSGRLNDLISILTPYKLFSEEEVPALTLYKDHVHASMTQVHDCGKEIKKSGYRFGYYNRRNFRTTREHKDWVNTQVRKLADEYQFLRDEISDTEERMKKMQARGPDVPLVSTRSNPNLFLLKESSNPKLDKSTRAKRDPGGFCSGFACCSAEGRSPKAKRDVNVLRSWHRSFFESSPQVDIVHPRLKEKEYEGYPTSREVCASIPTHADHVRGYRVLYGALVERYGGLITEEGSRILDAYSQIYRVQEAEKALISLEMTIQSCNPINELQLRKIRQNVERLDVLYREKRKPEAGQEPLMMPTAEGITRALALTEARCMYWTLHYQNYFIDSRKVDGEKVDSNLLPYIERQVSPDSFSKEAMLECLNILKLLHCIRTRDLKSSSSCFKKAPTFMSLTVSQSLNAKEHDFFESSNSSLSESESRRGSKYLQSNSAMSAKSGYDSNKFKSYGSHGHGSGHGSNKLEFRGKETEHRNPKDLVDKKNMIVQRNEKDPLCGTWAYGQAPDQKFKIYLNHNLKHCVSALCVKTHGFPGLGGEASWNGEMQEVPIKMRVDKEGNKRPTRCLFVFRQAAEQNEHVDCKMVYGGKVEDIPWRRAYRVKTGIAARFGESADGIIGASIIREDKTRSVTQLARRCVDEYGWVRPSDIVVLMRQNATLASFENGSLRRGRKSSFGSKPTKPKTMLQIVFEIRGCRGQHVTFTDAPCDKEIYVGNCSRQASGGERHISMESKVDANNSQKRREQPAPREGLRDLKQDLVHIGMVEKASLNGVDITMKVRRKISCGWLRLEGCLRETLGLIAPPDAEINLNYTVGGRRTTYSTPVLMDSNVKIDLFVGTDPSQILNASILKVKSHSEIMREVLVTSLERRWNSFFTITAPKQMKSKIAVTVQRFVYEDELKRNANSHSSTKTKHGQDSLKRLNFDKVSFRLTSVDARSALDKSEVRRGKGALGSCVKLQVTDFDLNKEMYLEVYMKGKVVATSVIPLALFRARAPITSSEFMPQRRRFNANALSNQAKNMSMIPGSPRMLKGVEERDGGYLQERELILKLADVAGYKKVALSVVVAVTKTEARVVTADGRKLTRAATHKLLNVVDDDDRGNGSQWRPGAEGKYSNKYLNQRNIDASNKRANGQKLNGGSTDSDSKEPEWAVTCIAHFKDLLHLCTKELECDTDLHLHLKQNNCAVSNPILSHIAAEFYVKKLEHQGKHVEKQIKRLLRHEATHTSEYEDQLLISNIIRLYRHSEAFKEAVQAAAPNVRCVIFPNSRDTFRPAVLRWLEVRTESLKSKTAGLVYQKDKPTKISVDLRSIANYLHNRKPSIAPNAVEATQKVEMLSDIEWMLERLHEAFVRRPFHEDLYLEFVRSCISIINAFVRNLESNISKELERQRRRDRRSSFGKLRKPGKSLRLSPSFFQSVVSLSCCPGLLSEVSRSVLAYKYYQACFLQGTWVSVKASSPSKKVYYMINKEGFVFEEKGVSHHHHYHQQHLHQGRRSSGSQAMAWAAEPFVRIEFQNMGHSRVIKAVRVRQTGLGKSCGATEIKQGSIVLHQSDSVNGNSEERPHEIMCEKGVRSKQHIVLAWSNGDVWKMDETRSDYEYENPILLAIAKGSMCSEIHANRSNLIKRVGAVFSKITHVVNKTSYSALKEILEQKIEWLDTQRIRKKLQGAFESATALLNQMQNWGVDPYPPYVVDAMLQSVETLLLTVSEGDQSPLPPRSQWALRNAMNVILAEGAESTGYEVKKQHSVAVRIAEIHRFFKLTPNMRKYWIQHMWPKHMLNKRQLKWIDAMREFTPPYVPHQIFVALVLKHNRT